MALKSALHTLGIHTLGIHTLGIHTLGIHTLGIHTTQIQSYQAFSLDHHHHKKARSVLRSHDCPQADGELKKASKSLGTRNMITVVGKLFLYFTID